MNISKQNFSASSPNFWASLLTFVFSIAALGGVNWGIDPALLSQKITTTLQGGSVWPLVGIIVTNIATPIFYVVKNKSFKLSLRSSNFWIQVATFLFTVGLMYGIEFQVDAVGSIVNAVAAKDWATLAAVGMAAFVNPLLRYLKDRIRKA